MKIKLSVNQSDYLTGLYLSEFTNHSTIDIEMIDYDTNSNQAIIPFTRYPIVEGKKFLGLGEYQRNYHAPVQSRAVIRNIQSAEFIKADTCEDIRVITIMFGINLKFNEICIVSAEEASGKHCYSASFYGNNLIFEIEDKENT